MLEFIEAIIMSVRNLHMDTFITKQDSKLIYGLAILFMILHHTLQFPEYFDYHYIPVLEIGSWNGDMFLGKLGHLCVPLYAFISGYGLTLSLNASFGQRVKGVFTHLFHFYPKF